MNSVIAGSVLETAECSVGFCYGKLCMLVCTLSPAATYGLLIKFLQSKFRLL